MPAPHGLEFVRRHMRLKSWPEGLGGDKRGFCKSCQQSDIALDCTTHVCSDCSVFRRVYKGTSQRLAGTLLVVSTSGTEVFSNSLTEADLPLASSFRTAGGEGGVEKLFFRRIILDPPQGPYVALRFGKARPFATDLRVNYDRDFVRISMTPLSVVSSGWARTIIECFDSEIIRALLSAWPEAKGQQWWDLIAFLHQERLGTLSAKEMTRLSTLRDCAADVDIDCLPSFNSPEHHMLKIVA